jgi:hypothetical protein
VILEETAGFNGSDDWSNLKFRYANVWRYDNFWGGES